MLYQLSYWSMLCPKIMERVKGIGPSQPAWKAGVLPLNYTRNIANIKILSQCNLCVKNYSKYFKKVYYKIHRQKNWQCILSLILNSPKDEVFCRLATNNALVVNMFMPFHDATRFCATNFFHF